MQAVQAHDAGNMKKASRQYTIREVPERMDGRLREAAARYGTSLNETALAALSRGLGMEAEPVIYRDLDDLIGTWVQDDGFDKALEAMDRVDAEMWTGSSANSGSRARPSPPTTSGSRRWCNSTTSCFIRETGTSTSCPNSPASTDPTAGLATCAT